MAGGKIFLEPIVKHYVGSIDSIAGQTNSAINTLQGTVSQVPGKIDQQILKLDQVVNAIQYTGAAPNIVAGTDVLVPVNRIEQKQFFMPLSGSDTNQTAELDTINAFRFHGNGSVICNVQISIVNFYEGYSHAALINLKVYKNDVLIAVFPADTTQFAVSVNFGDKVSIGAILRRTSFGADVRGEMLFNLISASYNLTQSTNPNVVVSGI